MSYQLSILPKDPCCICGNITYKSRTGEPPINLLKFKTKHYTTNKMIDHEFKFCNDCLEKHNIKKKDPMEVANKLVMDKVHALIMVRSGIPEADKEFGKLTSEFSENYGIPDSKIDTVTKIDKREYDKIINNNSTKVEDDAKRVKKSERKKTKAKRQKEKQKECKKDDNKNDNASEEEYKPVRDAILIPYNDNDIVKVLKINFGGGDEKLDEPTVYHVLKTDMTDHRTITWFEEKGYKLGIFAKDIADKDDEVNDIGSLIGNTSIRGNCILYDDCKDLTMDDYKEIINMSKTYDHEKYKKESAELFARFIKDLNKYTKKSS